MSDYKCAIVGVGQNRARGLAAAYQHISRGRLVAVSARTEESRLSFADQYSVDSHYSDYREMFEKERPDLVHVNTPPNVRLEVMEAAESMGVASLIVEKPLAVQGEDYREIREFAERAHLKVAINHQLHFHPRRFELQERVAAGEIGDIRFIDASCGMNLAYQGTHSLQAIGAFHPDPPVSVFGQVGGRAGLDDPRGKKHLSPDNAFAILSFSDGVQATLQSGETAPKVGRETINTHKRIAVHGTRGYVHWSMWHWEICVDGKLENGTHEYPDEDILGQARMTEAMFDWLETDNRVHPLNLESALMDFNTVLGVYTSALERRVVDLPFDPADGLIDQLRDRLT
jgi:predicted dehydrogenase